jgi:hypothetical protein
MNQFPKRSRASITKQTKQHILKVFNKIKEITHGDNGNVMKKYKIVEANDVIHNLTFLNPKFAVKRCVHKTKVTKFSLVRHYKIVYYILRERNA